MNPMGRQIPINPEQVRNNIKLTEAKIAMRKTELSALVKHGDMTRRLVTHLSREILHVPAAVTPDPVRIWCETHKLHEHAQEEVIQVAIMELERDLAVANFMLAEAEKSKSGLIT
jgi:hypothetical protein